MKASRKEKSQNGKIFDFNLAISSCMLKPSGSWVLHINSINVVFFNGLYCLVLRTTSYLDAFSTYSTMRSCAACFITAATPEASEYRSSRTRYSFHSDKCAPSRYHTNCLTYLRNRRFLEVQLPLEIKLLPMLIYLHGVDYTFILKTKVFMIL